MKRSVLAGCWYFWGIVWLVMPPMAHARSGIRGHVVSHQEWKPKLYIGRLADPDRTCWEDSIAFDAKGYFEYIFTTKQAKSRLIRVAAIPIGGGPNIFLEGEAENTIPLIVPDTGWIEIEARVDRLYYSCRVLSGPERVALEVLRDLKLPFLNFLRENRIDTGVVISSEQKAARSDLLDTIIGHYKRGILHSLQGPCSDALLLIGLYDYYISDRGRADPFVFNAVLQRITDTTLPLYRQFVQRVSFLCGLEGSASFPDPPLLKSSGGYTRLSGLKAQYLVLDFWASWCLPCRQAIKYELPDLQQQFKGHGVVVVGLSLDELEYAWLRALVDDRPSWPQYRDSKGPDALSRHWGINSIPYYVVLDHTCRIVFHSGLVDPVRAFLKEQVTKKRQV